MKNFEISGNLKTIGQYDNFCNNINLVFSKFTELFGAEVMSRIDLYVDNAIQMTGHTPIIIPVLGKYLFIKLGIRDFSNCKCIVFQFSHELCHYVFYSLKGIKKTFADDKEENLCAAMSLIMVKELFTEDEFQDYYNYALTLEEKYRLGAIIAGDLQYDITKLKGKIMEEGLCPQTSTS